MWNCFPFSYHIKTKYQSVCKVFGGRYVWFERLSRVPDHMVGVSYEWKNTQLRQLFSVSASRYFTDSISRKKKLELCKKNRVWMRDVSTTTETIMLWWRGKFFVIFNSRAMNATSNLFYNRIQQLVGADVDNLFKINSTEFLVHAHMMMIAHIRL